MNVINERYPDLLAGQDDPSLMRCVADLDRTCGIFKVPLQRDAAIARALSRRAIEQRPQGRAIRRSRLPAWISARWWQARARLEALALALLLVLGGAMGYLRLQSATPASAQVILQRTAATFHAASPDQVIHAVYTITAPGGVEIDGTAVSAATLDDWIQRDARGAITEATTVSNSAGALLSRTLQTGQTATTYDAASNTVQTGDLSQEYPALAHPFDPASLAQVVLAAGQGTDQTTHLLAQQTLDGALVDVVEVNRTDTEGDTTPRTVTLYVDAHTYVLRRLEVTSGTDPSASSATVQLVQYAAVPLSTVPANTFALNAPASARVVAPARGSQPLSVAQAVALPVGPALLLSGDPLGLKLQDVVQTSTPQFTVVNYLYHAAQNLFGVWIIAAPATATPSVGPLAPPASPGQALTLTIAGQTVHAVYYEPAAASRVLLFQQGTTTVRLFGDGLSKSEFFTAVQALVDGRTHPAVAAQLQQEMARDK